MVPRHHILFGLIFSILVWIFGVPLFFSLIIFLSSFLIDIDHYFYYAIKNKNWSIRKAYNCGIEDSKKKTHISKPLFAFFHTLEFLIILFCISLFYKILFFVWVGFMFHMALDIIDMDEHGELNMKNLSLIFALKNEI